MVGENIKPIREQVWIGWGFFGLMVTDLELLFIFVGGEVKLIFSGGVCVSVNLETTRNRLSAL